MKARMLTLGALLLTIIMLMVSAHTTYQSAKALSIRPDLQASGPLWVEAHARPYRTSLGQRVEYVASVYGGDNAPITGTLMITVTARLADVALETVPVFACTMQNDTGSLVVSCQPESSPTIVVLRGVIQGGSPRQVFIDTTLNSAADRDVQIILNARTIYFPYVVKE